MNTKVIIFLTALLLNAISFGMEVETQYSFTQRLKHILPEIKQEIAHYIIPSQWWYLDQTFQHNDWVNSACFDNEGKRLATSADNKARIFDIETQKEIAIFEHNDWVFSACFDNEGKRLATASSDRIARIFDIETKKETASFEHNNQVYSACFDSEENVLQPHHLIKKHVYLI